jgi:hypothetical protein
MLNWKFVYIELCENPYKKEKEKRKRKELCENYTKDCSLWIVI